jgi:TPR repeat protein
MPPEQFFVGSVNKSADVYAFGIVLFEMLTGRHPFAGWLSLSDDPWKKWAQVQQTVAPDLAHVGLPVRLQTLLERCLATDIADRYSSFEPIRTILAEEYSVLEGIAIQLAPVKPLDSTELGLKAAGLLELGLPSEGAECLVRILDLDESQDELLMCYERVASLLELFRFNNPGWSSGVGAVLLGGLAPGRSFIRLPVPAFPEAIRALESISHVTAIQSSALEMKARLFLIAGQYEDALTAFRQAIASRPRDEKWKSKLVALPLYQAQLWMREFKNEADADSQMTQCIRLAAQLGAPHAQYDLGLMYMLGNHVELSMFQAFVWLVLAARQGESRALGPLEEVYNSLQKNENFQLDARRPSALAQAKHNLGAAYYFGNGTEQDYREAANWFREAAEMGSADSRYSLGLMYKNGQGVERDLVMAYFWLHLGALQGDKDALAMRDSLAATMDPAQIAEACALIQKAN